MRPIWVDDNEIGVPALAHIATFLDAEDIGRCMTRFVDDELMADTAVGRKIEQRLHGMLHEWQT